MRFFVQTFHNRIFHFCNVNHFPWRHSFLELLYCKELVDISFCFQVFQGFLLKFLTQACHVTLDGLELQKKWKNQCEWTQYRTSIEAFPLCLHFHFGVCCCFERKKTSMHFLNSMLPRSDVRKPYKINMDCWLRFSTSECCALKSAKSMPGEPVFQSAQVMVIGSQKVTHHNSSEDVRLPAHFRCKWVIIVTF